MMDGWIVVRNWDKFQHYGKRQPVWIKLYTDLNSNDNWCGLSTAARGMLATIWMEYARSRGHLTVGKCMQLCGKSARSSHLDSLIHAGFIQVLASKPLAQNRTEEELDLEAEKKAKEDARAREPAARKTKAGKSKTRELPPDLLEQIARLGGTDLRSPAAIATFVRHGLPEAAFRNALEATHDARAHNRIHGTEIGYFVGTLNQLTDSGQYQ